MIPRTLPDAFRRRAPRLLGVLLVAVAFGLIAVGELVGLHACPHHEGPPAAESTPPQGRGHDGHEAGSHARSRAPFRAATVAAHGDSSGSGGHHRHDGPCTCIGTCHGSATAPLVPFGPPPVPVAAPTVPPSAAVSPRGPAARLLPHVLPFPNGPPAAA